MLLAAMQTTSAIAQQSTSITVQPSEIKLVAGDGKMVSVSVRREDLGGVLISRDGCATSHIVSILKEDTHYDGPLSPNSTTTVFLMSTIESGECTLTFQGLTNNGARVTKSIPVTVLPDQRAPLTVSPSRLLLSVSEVRRITAIGHASNISISRNTCGGNDPIASIVSTATQSGQDAGGRTITETDDLQAKRAGVCEIVFTTGQVVRFVDIQVR